jgi:hypothetical protein
VPGHVFLLCSVETGDLVPQRSRNAQELFRQAIQSLTADNKFFSGIPLAGNIEAQSRKLGANQRRECPGLPAPTTKPIIQRKNCHKNGVES